MEVRADLNRPVARVGHAQSNDGAAGVNLDWLIGQNVRTGRVSHLTPLSYSTGSNDGVVTGNELRSVRKRRFDVDDRNVVGNTVHHVGASENLTAQSHDVGHRLAVARAFEQRLGDQRYRLRNVEFQTAGAPPPRDV